MDSQEFLSRLKKIRIVLMDLDGVLTDGRVVYGDYGDELKFYDIQDGMGIDLLRKGGILTAIISGRKSRVNTRRAKELKISAVFQGVPDKLKIFTKLLKKYGVAPEEVCCIGDDLVDVPLMRRAGFAAAVQNAVPEVKRSAHYVTTKPGGRGAVREIADEILKAQGKWDAVTREFFS